MNQQTMNQADADQATKQDGRPPWPDLAGRALGGSVIYANDELFAERENLIKAEEPAFRPHTFGHKGQIMDGWETVSYTHLTLPTTERV